MSDSIYAATPFSKQNMLINTHPGLILLKWYFYNFTNRSVLTNNYATGEFLRFCTTSTKIKISLLCVVGIQASIFIIDRRQLLFSWRSRLSAFLQLFLTNGPPWFDRSAWSSRDIPPFSQAAHS